MFYQVLIETREAHFVISQIKYKSNTFIIEKKCNIFTIIKIEQITQLEIFKVDASKCFTFVKK